MMRCGSFNVRLDVESDGDDAWPNRIELVCQTIQSLDCDVIGLQEPLVHQFETLRECLPAYSWYGVGRYGDDEGEFSPIGWRTDRFEQIDGETRWLSPTPAEVGSEGWDASVARIATRVHLSDATGSLVVWNTHFDHEGEQARAESATLLAGWIESEGDPTVLVGDFNCEPGSTPHERLSTVLPSARDDAAEVAGPYETFHGFDGVGSECIDHIFVSVDMRVLAFETIDRDDQGRYPSDHFPVVASLERRDEDAV